MTYILGNKKFISLFQGSLEMQKYVFVSNLIDLIEDDETFQQNFMTIKDKNKLASIPKQFTYLSEYAKKIAAGKTGQEFLKLTKEHISKIQRESVKQFEPKYVISNKNAPLPGADRAHDEKLDFNLDASQPRKSTILSAEPAKQESSLLKDDSRYATGHFK
jgi:hypothetical protein